MSKIDYQLVADSWLDFLDTSLAFEKYTNYKAGAHFVHTLLDIDDLNRLDHLGFFLAMAIDSGGWSYMTLTKELEAPEDTLKDLYIGYSEVEYSEDYLTPHDNHETNPSVIRKELYGRKKA